MPDANRDFEQKGTKITKGKPEVEEAIRSAREASEVLVSENNSRGNRSRILRVLCGFLVRQVEARLISSVERY